MVSPVLFVGGEDLDFQATTGIIVSAATSGQVTIDTTTGRYRAGYARYAIGLPWSGQTTPAYFNIPPSLYAAPTFWLSCRLYASALWTGFGASHAILTFYDTGGQARLRIKTNGGTLVQLFSVNAAGTETQIGGNFSVSGPPVGLTKVDIQVNYATSGTFNVYFNGAPVFLFSGDITTNSVTTLDSRIDFAQWNEATNQSGVFGYSEVLVATADTRNLSVVTQAPQGSGNTMTFTASSSVGSAYTTTTSNSTSPRAANEVMYQKVVPSASGNLTTASMYLTGAVTGTGQMAVYSDVAGAPGTLLGSSATVTNPGAGYVAYAFASPVALSAGTGYWIAFRCTASYTMTYLSGSGLIGWGNQTGQTTFPTTAVAGVATTVTMVLQYTIVALSVSLNQEADATADNSATAGQIQQYQVSPALPTGNFSVVSLVQKARATTSGSGPGKLDFMTRTGGADFYSADVTLGGAWGTVSHNWDLNPNTGLAWQTSDILAGSTAYNMGVRSVT